MTFPVLSARAEGYEVRVVGDACGGLTPVSHDLSMRRMEAAGAKPTSWIQVLLELQRDWTRHQTYDGARSIVEAHGDGYGIGLAYARDMIKPRKKCADYPSACATSLGCRPRPSRERA